VWQEAVGEILQLLVAEHWTSIAAAGSGGCHFRRRITSERHAAESAAVTPRCKGWRAQALQPVHDLPLVRESTSAGTSLMPTACGGEEQALSPSSSRKSTVVR
jgi:hypothetical protein